MSKSLIDFEASQPFASRFFQTAISSGGLVNAYLLQGKDLNTMYRLALRLAQIINCSSASRPTTACGTCQSCRWIEDNAHPGVITVSNLTYLTSIDKETGLSKSKTGRTQQTIVVEQLDNLLQELALHSGGFHRVVILTGAQEVPHTPDEKCVLAPPPKDWQSQEDGTRFQPMPLDRKVFPERLANKFLKTLEEPPKDVLFFLLTDAQEKLLDTIVSRCQWIPFQTPADFYDLQLSTDEQTLLEGLWKGIFQQDFLAQTRLFGDYLNETGFTASDGISRLQHFIWMKANLPPGLDEQRFIKAKQFLTSLEQAKIMLRDRVKEEAVLEDLFLQLNLPKVKA